MGGSISKNQPGSFQYDMLTKLNTSCTAQTGCTQDMRDLTVEVDNCPNANVNIKQDCTATATCSGGDLVDKITSMVEAMDKEQTHALEGVMAQRKVPGETENVSMRAKTYLNATCKSGSSSDQKMYGQKVSFSCTPRPDNPFVLEATLNKIGRAHV